MTHPTDSLIIMGAHCTGKTTLARWVARTYGIPLIAELARAVIAEDEVNLSVLRLDVDGTQAFQERVYARQQAAEAEMVGKVYVADRSFDNLAYMCAWGNGFGKFVSGTDLTVAGKVIFIRPNRAITGNDGIREAYDWDGLIRIDAMIKMLLELGDVDYISCDTPIMAERQRIVQAVLGRGRGGSACA